MWTRRYQVARSDDHVRQGYDRYDSTACHVDRSGGTQRTAARWMCTDTNLLATGSCDQRPCALYQARECSTVQLGGHAINYCSNYPGVRYFGEGFKLAPDSKEKADLMSWWPQMSGELATAYVSINRGPQLRLVFRWGLAQAPAPSDQDSHAQDAHGGDFSIKLVLRMCRCRIRYQSSAPKSSA